MARLFIIAVALTCAAVGCVTCFMGGRVTDLPADAVPEPMPGNTFAGELPPLTPTEQEAAARLKAHVRVIAGDIGERNVWRIEKLDAAADYIQAQLENSGLKVRRQPYVAEGKTVANLETTIAGADPTLAAEIVVVGAHYDSVRGCPGANDNGTGVAAGLELARNFAGSRPARTLRIVFFVNEEPPFFHSTLMGSVVYAKECKARNDRVVAMLSLETMGFYSDQKGSQQYPHPFDKFFPDTGNYIGFVGDKSAGPLVSRCVESFRSHTQFPSQGCAINDQIQGIGWSDHWSFTRQGYPALMVTDTAPFRYRQYHTADDTPDRVDYGRLSRVTAGIERVIKDLLK